VSNKTIPLTMAVAFAITMFGAACSQAQVLDVTFSRPATNEFNLSSIDFLFGQPADVVVQIDQLGATDALFQNNDGSGQDFGIEAAGAVDSIGEVTIGQLLTPGTDFGESSLDVSTLINPGEDFYLGFSSGSNVGYLNVAWASGANGTITYSNAEYAIGGSSLFVAGVPEPASTAWLSAMGVCLLLRRRRAGS